MEHYKSPEPGARILWDYAIPVPYQSSIIHLTMTQAHLFLVTLTQAHLTLFF